MSAALLLLACVASDPAPTGLTVLDANVGTTAFLDVLGPSPHRQACSELYSDNLCTVAAEAAFAAAVAEAQPQIVLLQETLPPEACADDDPERACSLDGDQRARILPSGYRFACAADHPDNCFGWDPERFMPRGVPRGVGAACAPSGRVALLDGRLDGQPVTLAVLHLVAGTSAADAACRADQVRALDAALADVADAVILAGDANLDVGEDMGADAAALRALLEAHGLDRLPDDGPTHRLLGRDLDLVATRDLLVGAACTTVVPDDAAEPMFDHAALVCREGAQ